MNKDNTEKTATSSADLDQDTAYNMAEIRRILARQYDVKWYVRLWRGVLWGSGFGAAFLFFFALALFLLGQFISNLELFPGVKSYIIATIEGVRLLFAIRGE